MGGMKRKLNYGLALMVVFARHVSEFATSSLASHGSKIYHLVQAYLTYVH